MSALIHHFVVHQLTINQQQELVLLPRNACFEVNPAIEDLAQQINHAFNVKPAKGVGSFVDNEEDQAFAQLLKDMQSGELDFVDFSVKASERLKQSLLDTASVETGFVIFSHYQFLATDYLLITILNTKQHVEITRDLELTASDHLDLARMQLALRIDLTQLNVMPEQQRYISFIKGRMGRKVSDFFMHFIGCQELVDIKQQNKQLLNTVDAYLASEQLDPQEKHQARQKVAEYYKEKLEQGEDIQVKELAAKLPGEENRFYQFNQTAESPVEEHFQADRSALKTLAKFSGSGGGVTLSFERHLLGDRISYDPSSDTLMIRGIPPNLKDQLSKAQS